MCRRLWGVKCKGSFAALRARPKAFLSRLSSSSDPDEVQKIHGGTPAHPEIIVIFTSF